MSDIFISYRRTDAESVAYMLYKDLTRDGYSVFFDHQSLGGGDFWSNLEKSIQDSKDFVLVLSKSSLSAEIFREKDVYRFEIETALKYGKQIVGIALEDFEGFPDELPETIDVIRKANYIRLLICYYDAMYSKLLSGKFLTSQSSSSDKGIPSKAAIQSEIPEQLHSLASMASADRNASIQLLLQIMESFNNQERCMRFYQYIDIFDRKRGNEEIEPYSGEIPTDLTTYLSFFETLYIIVASKALDLSVIDYAYRFRFFAGCNNPVMQSSELLPLGYQYPNIMSFYNLWCDYIVSHYNHSQKIANIAEQIPLYDYDLHKNYAAYSFSNKLGTPISIRFLDRSLNWLNLTMRLIAEEEIGACLRLQSVIISNLGDERDNNIFEALTEEEMRNSLHQGVCIGLYDDNDLVAQMNLLMNPGIHEDLTRDLSGDVVNRNACILDYVVVAPRARGYSIQKTLLFASEYIARNYAKEGICAVASPRNNYSVKNFLSAGFSIVATQPKYKSVRHYFWKEINKCK